MYTSFFLKCTNELIGRQETYDRIYPACQRFHTAQFPGKRTDDRLVVYLYPAILKSFIYVARNIFRSLHIIGKFTGIHDYVPVLIPFYEIAGHFRTGQRRFHIEFRVQSELVYAEFTDDVITASVGIIKHPLCSLRLINDTVKFGKDCEMIISES